MKYPFTSFTCNQAEAMGYLPHPLISLRRARWNRLMYTAVRWATLGRIKLQFSRLLERPPGSFELYAKNEEPTALEIREAKLFMAMVPKGWATGATLDGAESANRIMRVAEQFDHRFQRRRPELEMTHVPEEPTAENVKELVKGMPFVVAPYPKAMDDGTVLMDGE